LPGYTAINNAAAAHAARLRALGFSNKTEIKISARPYICIENSIAWQPVEDQSIEWLWHNKVSDARGSEKASE